MTYAYLAVTIATIAANLGAGVADLARARFVLANAAEVAVPRTWLPALGTLKIAGALGVLLGLLGVRALGVAAAVGLILFFIGAVIAHLRVRALATIVGPGAYLALAVGSLILFLVQ